MVTSASDAFVKPLILPNGSITRNKKNYTPWKMPWSDVVCRYRAMTMMTMIYFRGALPHKPCRFKWRPTEHESRLNRHENTKQVEDPERKAPQNEKMIPTIGGPQPLEQQLDFQFGGNEKRVYFLISQKAKNWLERLDARSSLSTSPMLRIPQSLRAFCCSIMIRSEISFSPHSK